MSAEQTHGPARRWSFLPDRLPPRCLVGPDGMAEETVRMAVEAADDEALAAYADGVAIVQEIRRLLALQRRRADLVERRAFALARLRAYEQSRPDLVERVLTQEESA